MSKFPNISLAILAGGKSTRMGGRNKALLEYEGKSFIKCIHQSLNPIFNNCIIISNEEKNFDIHSAKVFPDLIKNKGPLGGIHSALVNSPDPIVFIVSCDMPFADSLISSILAEEFLLNKPDILVPFINSYKEPLFALYAKDLAGTVDSIVNDTNGRPITDLLKIANTLFFNLPDNPKTQRCFTNINSLEDLKRLNSG